MILGSPRKGFCLKRELSYRKFRNRNPVVLLEENQHQRTLGQVKMLLVLNGAALNSGGIE